MKNNQLSIPEEGGEPDGVRLPEEPPFPAHPLAEMFPPPTKEEWGALLASVEAEGVQVPVAVQRNAEGELILLDGVHRQRAARELSLPLPWRAVPPETSPLRVIAAGNVSRRHMTAGQRAAYADFASSGAAHGGDRKSDQVQNSELDFLPQKEAAAVMGVPPQQVSLARRVRLAPVKIAEAVKWEADKHDEEEVRGAVLDYPVADKILEAEKIYKTLWDGTESLNGCAKAAGRVLDPLPKQLEAAADRKKREVDAAEAAKERRWVAYVADITVPDTWEMEAESVDVIFTDPPYEQSAIPLIGHLARFAKHVLKPDGILLAVTGNMCADQWMARLSAELTYVWTMGVGLTQNKKVQGHPFYQHYKPIVLYRKGKMPDRQMPDFIRSDSITGQGIYHEWGQSVGLVMTFLSRFAPEGEELIIADPFLGAGSTGLAAHALGHRFIGFDSDGNSVDTAYGLLVEAERKER